jgi:NADPH-dependent 2,4-dienoyl-CoA reductase/sulfur reductase-like enzyme
MVLGMRRHGDDEAVIATTVGLVDRVVDAHQQRRLRMQNEWRVTTAAMAPGGGSTVSVCVIGAGLAGLATAVQIKLADRGIEVIVIDGRSGNNTRMDIR